MKTFITILLSFFGAAFITFGTLSAISRYNSTNDLLRAYKFQHIRDSLIIDSLRNPVDTTEFLTEHSGIKLQTRSDSVCNQDITN